MFYSELKCSIYTLDTTSNIFKDLIHARKIHARKTVLLRAINLFGVFAIGHDARKTRVNMDVLIPYQLLVYCSHELLVHIYPKFYLAIEIFTTQGRKYSARNVQGISCIPCMPRHLLGTC